MRIEDKLDKKTRDKLKRIRFSKKRRLKRKKDDKFSDRDLRNLMGVNRPTYKRYNGAFRQK